MEELLTKNDLLFNINSEITQASEYGYTEKMDKSILHISLCDYEGDLYNSYVTEMYEENNDIVLEGNLYGIYKNDEKEAHRFSYDNSSVKNILDLMNMLLVACDIKNDGDIILRIKGNGEIYEGKAYLDVGLDEECEYFSIVGNI